MAYKVLIIKLGYSETLDPEIGKLSSLGDVLRTTVLLHNYPNSDNDVTWLTDQSAYPLLHDNPLISRILILDPITILQLQAERFDIVINLEKVPGICALADSISAWQKFGFRLDAETGTATSYTNSHDALRIYSDYDSKRQAKRKWQEVLFEMVGSKWRGESYVLNYTPKSSFTQFDIGLNHKIGTKWPNKMWRKWSELNAELTKLKYSVSWQSGASNLNVYMDWISSCNTIITHDSLGLHIAMAMGKQVVALFGPTSRTEVHLYGLGVAVRPSTPFACLPCLRPQCHQETSCMDTIDVANVVSAIEGRIKDGNNGCEREYLSQGCIGSE